MSPATPPPVSNFDVADSVLQSRSDVIASIQQSLADVANGQAASSALAIKGAKQRLTKAMGKQDNARANIAGMVASSLGSMAGGTLSDRASVVNGVAVTAATAGGAAVAPAMVTAANSLPSSAFPPPSGPVSLPAGGGTPFIPQPDSTGNWVVYSNCNGPHVGSPVLIALQELQPIIPFGYAFAGINQIFPSQAAANQWIAANQTQWIRDNCPSLTVPPIPTPTPTPPAGPGQPTGDYLVDIGWDGCNYGWVIASSTGANVTPDAFNADIVAVHSVSQLELVGSYTFAGIDAAVRAWLAAQDLQKNPNCAGAAEILPAAPAPPASIPPPVCPPLPKPAPPPTCDFDVPEIACPLLANGTLPNPGSEEWCQCVGSIADWLDSLGQWMIGKIQDWTSPSESDPNGTMAQALLAATQSTLNWQGLGIISNAISKSSAAQSCIVGTLLEAVGKFAAITSTKLLGIAVARALINALRLLRVGTDLVVWATLDIEVHLMPLERVIFYVENYLFQYEIPGIGEAIECQLQRTAPQDQIQCWMACHGANFDVYSPVIDAKREKLDTAELIQYIRRSGGDNDAAVAALTQQGWYRKYEADARVALYDELPSVSDVLLFLTRNVFDTQYVQDFRLLEGYAEKFYPRYGAGLRALGVSDQTIQDHYAAHWINPSMGQLAEMRQRLRPGRVDESIQFTDDDFQRVMAEQDVAPYFRPRLFEISFRTLPIRQLNSLSQQGKLTQTELEQRWQDIGFTPADSVLLAETSLIQAKRQAASAGKGFTASLLADLAEFKIVDKAFATPYLTDQGFTQSQIDDLFSAAALKRKLAEYKRHTEGTLNAYAAAAIQAYVEGTVSYDSAFVALKGADYSDDAATLSLQTATLKLQMESTKAAVALIHTGFLYGETDPGQTLNALTIAGVVPPMGQSYLARWQLELTVRRVTQSAGKIIGWAKKGILSIANASQRLANLGWNAIDIDLQLAEVEQAVKQAQALAAQRNARQLALAQKAAQQAIKASQRASCKYYTPSRMKSWYAERIIDESTFRSRLAQCGTDPALIDAFFADAEIARANKDAKAASKGAVGIQYTGPGGDTSGPAP